MEEIRTKLAELQDLLEKFEKNAMKAGAASPMVVCECGATTTKGSRWTHLKSAKHKSVMNLLKTKGVA